MVWNIEEVWKQKPMQTVVVVSWGKIAVHMASIKTVYCVADKLVKGVCCVLCVCTQYRLFKYSEHWLVFLT